MEKPLVYLTGGVCAYFLYRYLTLPETVTLADDASSTAFTIGEWLMPTDIPFACVDPKTKQDYKPQIQYAAKLTGVPALLLAALIRQESKFDHTVVNRSSGAMGLGQFMPATAKEWFGATWQAGVFDPDRAIVMSARYLAWLYRRHGTWRNAVAAYNWGTGNVATKGLAKAPTETREYVRIVYDAWAGRLPA